MGIVALTPKRTEKDKKVKKKIKKILISGVAPCTLHSVHYALHLHLQTSKHEISSEKGVFGTALATPGLSKITKAPINYFE